MAFALNHMTVPELRCDALLSLASNLGCVGVEFRNDLNRPLFDGLEPDEVAGLCADAGLRILAVAEVKSFNDVNDKMLQSAEDLMDTAKQYGAEAVALIPRNDGARLGTKERRDDLRLALRELGPRLEARDLKGFVEPLGFESCALRQKDAVIDDIYAVSGIDRFQTVHDSFHHHLAGGGPVFAAETALVHISGVTEDLPTAQMTDAHRGLAGPGDRLNTTGQIIELMDAGYTGPISQEAFAPEVHAIKDPEDALSRSFTFIGQHLAGEAA